MADTAVKEKADEETTDGGKKKMLLVGVFLGIAAVAAYVMLFAGGSTPEDEAVVEPTEAPAEDGDVFEVATLTVNLRSEDLRYARVQFGVVANAASEVADPSPKFPLLQDRAISTIAEFTPEELRTVAGHDALRAALNEDVAVVWPDGEVLRVVLYDLIVQ